jgi:hypothetical protein
MWPISEYLWTQIDTVLCEDEFWPLLLNEQNAIGAGPGGRKPCFDYFELDLLPSHPMMKPTSTNKVAAFVSPTRRFLDRSDNMTCTLPLSSKKCCK